MLTNNLFINFVKSLVIINLLIWPVVVLAAPTITAVTLNNNSTATFNPYGGEELTINLTASEPVKFSTIAICAVAEVSCTRTIAVKYFTQTTKYDTSVEKIWDGKKGGSNPDYVPTGDYRLVVTIAGQNASDQATIDLAQNVITVANTGSYGGGDPSAEATTTTNEVDPPGDNSTTTADSQTNYNNSDIGTENAYSSYGSLTNYTAPSKLIVGLGRNRLAVVGAEVNFKGLIKDYPFVPNFRFSFGDGTSGAGQQVSHSYAFPGVYQVILTASGGGEESVARTTVTVVPATVELKDWRAGYRQAVLHNFGNSEINIGEFKLVGNGVEQSLAPDTIIKGHTDLSIYLNDRLGEAQKLSLQNKFGVEVAKLNLASNQTVGSVAVVESLTASSTEALAKEELTLAQTWEKQLTNNPVQSVRIAVADTKKSQSQARSTEIATTSNLLTNKIVSPAPELKSTAVAAVNLVAVQKPTVYQVNSPRLFWAKMVNWINGIFNP